MGTLYMIAYISAVTDSNQIQHYNFISSHTWMSSTKFQFRRSIIFDLYESFNFSISFILYLVCVVYLFIFVREVWDPIYTYKIGAKSFNSKEFRTKGR